MGKTECIIFGSKRKLRKINNFSVECNGHTIKAQRSVKYLGLTLDDQLTGEAIVNSIVQKVNGRLKFLYRQCNFSEEKLRKSICSALIQCHIDYACSSWYSGLNKSNQISNQINLFSIKHNTMFIAYKQNKHENITYRHIYNINIDTFCIIRGAFFVSYLLR